ncbi:MAG TPA: hypothetical protein VFJ24_11860 [Gaiellales bacterium]|nr:hypothetical protein [Gaiellales bacterium]
MNKPAPAPAESARERIARQHPRAEIIDATGLFSADGVLRAIWAASSAPPREDRSRPALVLVGSYTWNELARAWPGRAQIPNGWGRGCAIVVDWYRDYVLAMVDCNLADEVFVLDDRLRVLSAAVGMEWQGR